MAVTARPHDLLRLTENAALGAMPPDWASASLAACPWGVVRRAPRSPGFIPIGVRGLERWQRHATVIPAGAVTRSVPPEELREQRPRLSGLAATLSAVALCLAAELGDVVWGPIGSVGFELASGRPVTHPGSDLDLLVRIPRRLERAQAARLAAAFTDLPGKVDCQLETPCGGVGLTEWAGAGGPVMARTDHGPELVNDPWTPA
ncbi:malonate decarboxylase holo-ACP synthase [Actinoallomurus bryophytorum]|uniref:Phosphoribosyl-dephospho-CoA transferase n=1 Tax=Actinoallomurus bryophytorum TaxID=1490222 RepID=A0A543C152_9ACTN|nr:malonate decarboxylase holo-ACP synthase [Actinoallomurus bryophytorum]TQL90803.1 phosphoribosyl-dephospho-CoA transferase [Actinoallomurus bryophytorum]